MSVKKPVTDVLRVMESPVIKFQGIPSKIFDIENLKLHALKHVDKVQTTMATSLPVQVNGACGDMSKGVSQVAVLWDMENVSPRVIDAIMQHLAAQGFYASIRWAFGDIEAQCVAQRKKGLVLYRDTCFKHAFRVKPSPAYVTGKNTADIEMVVAAMQLLHTNDQIEGFVLISSDSDFTPLAIHLREHNKIVLGYGCVDTVESFVHACTKFVFVERLREHDIQTSIVSQENRFWGCFEREYDACDYASEHGRRDSLDIDGGLCNLFEKGEETVQDVATSKVKKS